MNFLKERDLPFFLLGIGMLRLVQRFDPHALCHWHRCLPQTVKGLTWQRVFLPLLSPTACVQACVRAFVKLACSLRVCVFDPSTWCVKLSGYLFNGILLSVGTWDYEGGMTLGKHHGAGWKRHSVFLLLKEIARICPAFDVCLILQVVFFII